MRLLSSIPPFPKGPTLMSSSPKMDVISSSLLTISGGLPSRFLQWSYQFLTRSLLVPPFSWPLTYIFLTLISLMSLQLKLCLQLIFAFSTFFIWLVSISPSAKLWVSSRFHFCSLVFRSILFWCNFLVRAVLFLDRLSSCYYSWNTW